MVKKVVAIGGGHGLSTIVKSLKSIENIDIKAIVTVADDGGSTGRLRRIYDMPAVGDIRNVMVSMASQEKILQRLMEYRFTGDKEEDVMGHNLGNLIITALCDITGSLTNSIRVLSQILDIKGDIIPSSDEVITLYAKMMDGTIVKGEANIPEVKNHISEVYYDHEVSANAEAIRAINEADYIIYGIGSLYTSILPNIIIKDINKALKKSKARKIYICNTMTQPGETDGYSLEDHVGALEKHGALVKEVVYSCDEIPPAIIARYHESGSTHVDLHNDGHRYNIIKKNLLNFNGGVIRHDSDKLRDYFITMLKE